MPHSVDPVVEGVIGVLPALEDLRPRRLERKADALLPLLLTVGVTAVDPVAVSEKKKEKKLRKPKYNKCSKLSKRTVRFYKNN